MINFGRFLIFSLFLLPMLGLVQCSSSSEFTLGSLPTVLDNQLTDDPEFSGVAVDGDDDGVVDSIDTDGDGDGDIPFDPPTDDPGDTDYDDDDTVDPPIRDDQSGACITVGSEVPIVSGNADNTITTADLGSATSIIVTVASSGTQVVIDMTGATHLKRLIVHHSGNSNTVSVRNAEMTHGFCNEGMTGGSNVEILEDTSSAPVVDLMGGSGNNNSLAVLFLPDIELVYHLSGTSHCISAPDGTVVSADSTSNDHDHDLFFDTDGTECLP